MPLEPIEHTNLSDKVYERLKQGILTRQFAPGQRLNVDQLSEQLGVSRTPLKDALNRLSAEGLVKIVPRQGTFVTKLTPRDIAELFAIRRVLEAWAVEEAVRRITPQELEELRRLLDEMARLVNPDGTCTDYLTLVAKDRDFHLLIIKASGNRKLFELYKNLNVHIQVAVIYYLDADKRVEETLREHEAILRALESRDVEAAREALNTHLKAGELATLERVK